MLQWGDQCIPLYSPFLFLRISRIDQPSNSRGPTGTLLRRLKKSLPNQLQPVAAFEAKDTKQLLLAAPLAPPTAELLRNPEYSVQGALKTNFSYLLSLPLHGVVSFSLHRAPTSLCCASDFHLPVLDFGSPSRISFFSVCLFQLLILLQCLRALFLHLPFIPLTSLTCLHPSRR